MNCIQFNSIQDYLYSAFYDTIIAKQLYRKLCFYNIFIYRRNLIYLTYGNIWLILYIIWLILYIIWLILYIIWLILYIIWLILYIIWLILYIV